MEGLLRQNNHGEGSSLVAAAHELKAPLALIRQLSLNLEASTCTPQQAQRLLRQITLTSERALRLTTDLTKSIRLEDGLFAVEPINPLQICDEVVQELAPLYQAKDRHICIAKRQRRLLLVLANKDLLRRVLLNFADNALHYGEPHTAVSLSVHERNGRIRVSVRDFGPAVPAKLWARLGKTIGVSAQPLHSRPQSSGLGMMIAKQFAESMNATVGVLRHQDGATFYIDVLPSTQLRLL
ncbi:MAG: HAMP domain-containing sensor histidine kinase [Candidatus Saccharimonas sp.]